MTFTKQILFLLIFFSFLSCERESDLSLDPLTSDLIQILDNPSKNLNHESQNRGSAIEGEFFKKRLQWASYITAKVLRNTTPAVRSAIQNMAATNNNVIALEDLLGNNIFNPNINSFKNDFIIHLDDFLSYTNQILPEHDKPTPPKPITHSNEENDIVNSRQIFIDFFVEEVCAELYFPNGLTFIPNFSLKSTAHPLYENINSNDGFKRNFNDQKSLNGVTIDLEYVNQNNNIIIARPVRDMNSNICDYDEFSIEDFTVFPE